MDSKIITDLRFLTLRIFLKSIFCLFELLPYTLHEIDDGFLPFFPKR